MGNHHGRASKEHRKNHYIVPSSSAPANNNPPSSSSAPGPSAQTIIPSSNMGLSLPYAHVDSSLRALAAQAEGFGRCAIGGLHGALYHVTTLAGFTPLYMFKFLLSFV